jgi:hypothetical protein
MIAAFLVNVVLSVTAPAVSLADDWHAVEIARDAIQPQIAMDAKGVIYAAFLQRGNICCSVSRDAGRTFSEPVIAIDVRGRMQGGMQRGPRIGVDAQGQITITAPAVFDPEEFRKRYPTADLYFVRSSDSGKSSPVRVNQVPKQAPESLHWLAVAPSGDAHVVWLDRRERSGPGQDIYYTKVAGGEVGEQRRIAEAVCECCAPGLAVDGHGNPFAAYRDGGKNSSRELFALRSEDGGHRFQPALQMNQRPSLEDT